MSKIKPTKDTKAIRHPEAQNKKKARRQKNNRNLRKRKKLPYSNIQAPPSFENPPKHVQLQYTTRPNRCTNTPTPGFKCPEPNIQQTKKQNTKTEQKTRNTITTSRTATENKQTKR